MFFNSAYNVQVIVDDNEPEERLLGRFRREVMRAGVIQECKRRRYFENTQDTRKRKTREAAKRNRRRFVLGISFGIFLILCSLILKLSMIVCLFVCLLGFVFCLSVEFDC